MPKICMQGIVKQFGSVIALNNVDLQIEDGSFTTLLGPSGCGKTTLLRILSGLEGAQQGKITVNGSTIMCVSEGIDKPPKERELGLVFQSYALWPHMTVFDNVAYGLRVKKVPIQEIRKRVSKTLTSLQMQGLDERYPSELSGGQQQRVAIARMLVIQPSIMLMDEPLSNLDARLRMDMRVELQRIYNDLGLTVVYVTHDQAEAMTLSSKVAVMKDGIIQQYAAPEDIYLKPANKFVAEFIGNPRMNFIEGSAHQGKVETKGNFQFQLRDRSVTSNSVTIGVRPEDIVVGSENGQPFSIYASLMSGPDTYLSVYRDDVMLLVRVLGREHYELDEEVKIFIPEERINVFDHSDTLIA